MTKFPDQKTSNINIMGGLTKSNIADLQRKMKEESKKMVPGRIQFKDSKGEEKLHSLPPKAKTGPSKVQPYLMPNFNMPK